jgi:hypothetical protein
LGGRIQLGHAIGEPCPLPVPAFGDSFTIIDTNGIHDVGLDFCGCGRYGTMTQQLLRFRLYPATVQNPNTASTFRALHHFQLLSFESKCSVYEFYQTLVRESDNTSCRKVKACANHSRSIANLADNILRIATKLFSKWFDNGVT